MSDIQLIHILLQTLLFLIFLVSGYFLSKTRKSKTYWQIAIVPIIAFSIISGLRFGRDIDYNVYYFVYTVPSEYKTMEPFFVKLIDFFHYFELPYYLFVLFCSSFLIISFLYLLEEFKTFAIVILPLFLGVQDLENLMRWFLAFSFVLIGVRMMMNKRFKFMLLFFFISVQIHLGMLFCFPFILGSYFFVNRQAINSKIAIVLFSVTLFLGSTDQLLSLTSLINISGISGGSEKVDTYTSNVTDIASGGMKSGVYERSLSNNIRLFLCYAIPMFFCDKLVYLWFKEKGRLWLYNLVMCVIIIMPIFILVEIFNRVAFALNCFSIIFVGVMIYYGYKTRAQNKLRYFALLTSFTLLVYPILKKPFVAAEKEDNVLYIWDADGRTYIPY